MAVPPIYNPVIPCVHPIPGGLYPGRMIRIQGNTPPGAQRFAINFQCGPNTDPRDDIALHLNFRFVEQCVVRNHLTAMNWGVEDTAGGMPLQRGDSFEALILCEPQSLKVALNGVHFCEFLHRIPFQRVSHITVDGDVMIQLIGFEGAQPPPSQMYMSEPPSYGAYGAPPPNYGAPGYGPPQAFASVAPYETQTTYVQTQRRGLGTGAAVGLGVGALAAGGLAGYALAGGFGGDSPPREEAYGSDYPPSYYDTPSAPLDYDARQADIPTDWLDQPNETPTEMPDQSNDATELANQVNEVHIGLPNETNEIPTELSEESNEIHTQVADESNEIPTDLPDEYNETPTGLTEDTNKISTISSNEAIGSPGEPNEPVDLPEDSNEIPTGAPEIIEAPTEEQESVHEDPDDSIQVSSFSEAVEFGGDDDWMD